jgi:hypothetical protein
MNHDFLIKMAVLLKVIDRSITTTNMKHFNRLSSRIMPTQINMFNM